MARLWVVSTRGWVQSNSSARVCVCAHENAYVYWRGICLMPHVSRDRKNNEKLCRDFKANIRSFPVVMADTGLRSGNKHAHTLSHILALVKWTPHPLIIWLEPKKRRTTSLKSLCVLLLFDPSLLAKVLRSKHAMQVQCQTPAGKLFFTLNWIWNLQNNKTAIHVAVVTFFWYGVLFCLQWRNRMVEVTRMAFQLT